MDSFDEQWEIVSPLIPETPRPEGGRGRRCRDPRDVLHGILRVIRMGAPWKDLPHRHPPCQTCHRPFQQWSPDGPLHPVLETLPADPCGRGPIGHREASIHGIFAGARKGAPASA